MDSSKVGFRKEVKIAESEFLASGRSLEESQRIFKAVSEDPLFQASDTVLLYMSISGEVSTEDFISYCVNCGKRVAVPKVVGSELSLRLYDPKFLVPGYKGIMEPSEDSTEIPNCKIDLAIIPGIAFAPVAAKSLSENVYVSNSGFWRLGRGGGFYDRLLSELSCPVFAVAFPFRIFRSIPVDPWDSPVDKVFY